MNTETIRTAPAPPWLWGTLFAIAMAGIAAASIFELVGQPWTTVLLLTAMGLLVPVVSGSRRKAEVEGCMSPALRTYNNRVLVAGAIYMISFWIAANVYDAGRPPSTAVWLLALIPAVPLLGMIWAMVRYIAEESDEYLRQRAMTSALVGLALVLVVGTVWGFLETFSLVPHVWSWWVFPVWALGLAAGRAWPKAHGE